MQHLHTQILQVVELVSYPTINGEEDKEEAQHTSKAMFSIQISSAQKRCFMTTVHRLHCLYQATIILDGTELREEGVGS